jgi:hypothetical protein
MILSWPKWFDRVIRINNPKTRKIIFVKDLWDLFTTSLQMRWKYHRLILLLSFILNSTNECT